MVTRTISLRRFLGDSFFSWRAGRSVWVYWIAPVFAALFFSYNIVSGPVENIMDRSVAVLDFTAGNGAPFALLAIGAGLVLATGGVDLSVAGSGTLAGLLFAALAHSGFASWLSATLAVALGGLLGLVLGSGVAAGLPPLISSWALGTLWATAALTASALLPDFGFLNASVTGLSLPLRDDLRSSALLSVIVVVASAFALNVSNLPRQAKAVGANRDSAAYAGVNYRKVLYLTYGINGAFAGTAGVLFALLNSSASTVDLQGRELIAIATAVLGGTVMTGGYLNLWSISMAAALWKLMELTIFGVRVSVFPDFQQRIITVLFACAILVLAYVSARLEKNLFVQGLLEPKHSQSRNRRSRNE